MTGIEKRAVVPTRATAQVAAVRNVEMNCLGTPSGL